MKPSDIQELQRKLEKLQYQLQQNGEQEYSEEPSNAEAFLESIPANRHQSFKNLTIDDFHVFTTLGTFEIPISNWLRYGNLWKS